MKKEKYNVAVVGATGAVGREMLSVLESREFPVGELRLLASERSRGEFLPFKGNDLPIKILDRDLFSDIDIALFSAGGAISQEYAPIAAKAGAVVIDNTSAYRLDPKVPLVVPEVNPQHVALYKEKGIIANPNCSTIQLVAVLKPIHDAAGLKRVVVSTYQSTSGAGQKAIDELATQVQALFNQGDIVKEVFPHQIAFNCIPHIDAFQENGYTKEEIKMILESQKILEIPDLRITVTCVRVPVFHCHSEAVNIETERPLTVEALRELLAQAPGVLVRDNPAENEYPLGINAVGHDEVYVGRIRRDESVTNGFNLWVVSDNLRKGAAVNAVQIAEILIENYL